MSMPFSSHSTQAMPPVRRANPFNLPWLTVMAAMAAVLKYVHAICTTDALTIFLRPVNFLVAQWQPAPSTYIPHQGYYFAAYPVLIDRSCAGVNFFIISFCSFFMACLPYHTTGRRRLTWLGTSLVLAYAGTIVTNAARITTALLLRPWQATLPAAWRSGFHEAQGALFYLFALVLTTVVLTYCHQKFPSRYAKLS